MVYHSAIEPREDTRTVCGCPILPIRGSIRGPAPPLEPQGADEDGAAVQIQASASASGEEEDIVDEALHLFRANVLFRSFPVKRPGDRLLIYLTLYLSSCLKGGHM